ncbi:MAG: MFS transporter [Pseudomonas sp.]|uniref:MFS transporter n=1 Tax=Pseudomonas abieticivorans TaxID=2931382 RepID=UPI0020BDA496|nr:MFS transporter [Pseudomonas sp. PIA16]MDE1166667.1 MFS transporter [Pseudomonas sp.]
MMKTRDNSYVTPRIRKARLATFGGFMILGAMLYTWSVGVSAFRSQLGLQGSLGDLDFGMVALGIGIGSTIGALGIGRFLDRFGPKTVIRWLMLLYPVSIIALGFASQFWFAMLFGMVLGTLRGATDTALNAHGVQVERFYQRPIMAAFHAFFSLGGFFFGILASYLAGLFPLSAAAPFTFAGISLAILSLLANRYMLGKHELLAASATDSPSGTQGWDWRVLAIMIAFGALLTGGMVSESAVNDWGQEFLIRETGLSISTAGLAISLFTGAGFIGRITGDRLAELIGVARMLLCCGLTAIAGICLATLSSTPLLAMGGFALLGLGLSCIAPLMLSSAGRKDPANAGRNVGIVNGIGFSGLLGGPAAYSLVVSTFGIHALFYIPLVLISLLTLLGPLLMKVRPQHSKPPRNGASIAAK